MAHPLNLAVAYQILEDLRRGQMRSCLEMGFAEHDLKSLIEPSCMSLLVNAPVPWVRVVVDNLMVQRLLTQARKDEEDRLIMQAISAGASSPLIHELFGLSAKEVALRRGILGIPNRRGRWPVMTQPQEQTLWELWVKYGQQTSTDPRDARALLVTAMQLTEAMPEVNLTMVWNTLQSWIEQDLL
ncbi:DUF2857 domain-containing protein [Pseudomonas sp. LJDD11]|uniref:DUF2857 domain-containing protein n=1 Tax=unclassified Pseudomonas TaxID=196821 RepID=UPI0020969E1D|nr:MULTISPECIES: DUF2857 domain-containing protein [unclassified Pseudomonas]MCO8165912.1 DUF2857 domain-containing protein [Pseudomonas sp. 21LCFQ010]MCQ9422299.1 DUF2857 domain-containing protein [Pseudomonas sp. LJDD11]